MSETIDFRKTLKQFYMPSNPNTHIVDVPPMNFLMIDGTGNPNTSPEYQQAVEALYAMAYALRFKAKHDQYVYSVSPLEGLWWMDNMEEFTVDNKDRWLWTMMIMQPEIITSDWVEKARSEAYKKKKLPSILRIQFTLYDEGHSLQTLYTGPYSGEGPTIAKMHDFINSNGYRTNGKHHEIYLSDPRKTPQDKLLTILRQPIRKV